MSSDPPDKILIEAVLDGLKHGVIFLTDDTIPVGDVERLVKKTEILSMSALMPTFGEEASKKFFAKSNNAWILRTSFGGWVFFFPIESLTPEDSMSDPGQPEFVYWPDANGHYGRVSWSEWRRLREAGNVWRPMLDPHNSAPKTIWERLRNG